MFYPYLLSSVCFLLTLENYDTLGFVLIFFFLVYHLVQGENPKKPGNPHNVRLYSIASTRYGDSFDGKTASLCVRRAVYYDPETGKEDPSKNGVCSNFLCDSKPGDKVQITGKITMNSSCMILITRIRFQTVVPHLTYINTSTRTHAYTTISFDIYYSTLLSLQLGNMFHLYLWRG